MNLGKLFGGFGKKNKQDKPAAPAEANSGATQVVSPLSGIVVPLSEVPDPAFAGGAIGAGVAIDPDGDTVFAPADGTIVMTFPTGHAVGLKLDNSAQMLIHVGIDTVSMDGKGFEVLVAKGDVVKAGDPLVKFDRAAIVDAGYSLITPVLVTNHKKFEVSGQASGPIQKGDRFFTITPAGV